jgi:MFS family permease
MSAGIGLLVLVRRNADSPASIALALVLLGLAHLGIGVSPTVAVLAVAMVAVGITVVTSRTVLSTHLMHQTDPEFAGRVQGAVVFLQAALVLASGLLVGLGSGHYGIRPAYLALGALVAVCGVLPLFRWNAVPAATPREAH